MEDLSDLSITKILGQFAFVLSKDKGCPTQISHKGVLFEQVNYTGIANSCCGYIMRTNHGLPCAYELSRYVVGSIPLDTVHMFWRRLRFSNQGLSESKVCITEEMKAISKRFEELHVCGKVTLKSKLWEILYLDLNSMCASPEKVKTKGAQKKQITKQEKSTKCDSSY